MKVKAFSLNEIGGRKNVEDAILPQKYTQQDPQLFIVCDGVGGSSFGEIASDIATKTFYEVLQKSAIINETEFKELLHKALSLFQERVAAYIVTNPAAHTTSTTLTLLAIHNEKIFIAWCGDSKIYQLRNGKPVYKSNDHSLVAELVARGVITTKEAATHPQKNVITRSISTNTKPADIEMAVLTDIREGDWFLLCTDGLMEQFTEEEFEKVLNHFDDNTDYSAVIDGICRNRTRDNYSMYLLHLSQVGTGTRMKKILLPALLLLLLGVGGWLAYSQLSGKDNVENPVHEKQDTVRSIMMVKPQGDSSGKKDTTRLSNNDSLQ